MTTARQTTATQTRAAQSRRPNRPRRHALTCALAALLAIAQLSAGCSDCSGSSDANTAIHEVQVIRTTAEDLPAILEADATLRTAEDGGYEAEFRLPVDRLTWLSFARGRADAGTRMELVDSDGEHLASGRVDRRDASAEGAGADALLIASIDANSMAPAIPEDARVRVHGPLLRNVVPIPREAMQTSDVVYVVSPTGVVERRQPIWTWQTASTRYVAPGGGVAAGELLIVSPLSADAVGQQVETTLRAAIGDD